MVNFWNAGLEKALQCQVLCASQARICHGDFRLKNRVGSASGNSATRSRYIPMQELNDSLAFCGDVPWTAISKSTQIACQPSLPLQV